LAPFTGGLLLRRARTAAVESPLLTVAELEPAPASAFMIRSRRLGSGPFSLDNTFGDEVAHVASG
jgi:hypothetical protein